MHHFTLVTLFLITMTGFANSAVPFDRYQQTHIEISNQTRYVELVKMHEYQGVWKKPIVNNQFFELKSGQMYQNTLLSLTKDHIVENFASFTIARRDSSRENYLIFAESTDSKRQEIVADIFDGLGDMFVSSWTNECKEMTVDGYPVCQLVIFDKS